MSKERFTYGWEDTPTRPRKKGFKVGTLWCERRDVDGEVTLSLERFDTMSDTAKIDLLDDFIGLLKRERDMMLDKIPDHVCHHFGWPDSEERKDYEKGYVVVGDAINKFLNKKDTH